MFYIVEIRDRREREWITLTKRFTRLRDAKDFVKEFVPKKEKHSTQRHIIGNDFIIDIVSY